MQQCKRIIGLSLTVQVFRFDQGVREILRIDQHTGLRQTDHLFRVSRFLEAVNCPFQVEFIMTLPEQPFLESTSLIITAATKKPERFHGRVDDRDGRF
jgi:hypothetical protein